jgi:hypothetical protein
MHVDLSLLRSAEAASFDKKSSTGTAQLFSTEYKQEVSEFLLPYDGSTLKKCARFTESVTKIIQPSKYKIILFENLCF